MGTSREADLAVVRREPEAGVTDYWSVPGLNLDGKAPRILAMGEAPVSERILAPSVLDEPQLAPEVPAGQGGSLDEDRNPHSTPR